jgi:hypothetical protein
VLSFTVLHHAIAWDDAIEEAIRVLRPGRAPIGYDVLAPRVRVLHQDGGAATAWCGTPNCATVSTSCSSKRCCGRVLAVW